MAYEGLARVDDLALVMSRPVSVQWQICAYTGSFALHRSYERGAASVVDLRLVGDESPALSLDELRSHGNVLLTDARRAAMDALHASTSVDLFRRGNFSPAQVKVLHQQARAAVTAWAQVESALGELVREFDKSNGRP